jgi:anaerobic selenocysteine-containing dehydrogenase
MPDELPTQPGLDTLAGLDALHAGDIDVFASLGGNLLSAAPDTARAAAALGRAKLSLHIATSLNRSHLVVGETALLLPCRVRGEVAEPGVARPHLTLVDALGGLVRSQGQRQPDSESDTHSEPWILSRLGEALFPARARAWRAYAEDFGRVREDMAKVVPGFAEALEAGRGEAETWRGGARTRRFASPHGRAQLSSASPPPALELAEDELLLTSLRAHDQHNSSVFADGDRHRGIQGYRRLVMMNLEDMRRFGIEPYERVDLASRARHPSGEEAGEELVAERWVAVPHDIPRGCLAAYFPEANALIPWPRAEDGGSSTPAYKSVIVRVQRRDEQPPKRTDKQ